MRENIIIDWPLQPGATIFSPGCVFSCPRGPPLVSHMQCITMASSLRLTGLVQKAEQMLFTYFKPPTQGASSRDSMLGAPHGLDQRPSTSVRRNGLPHQLERGNGSAMEYNAVEDVRISSTSRFVISYNDDFTAVHALVPHCNNGWLPLAC